MGTTEIDDTQIRPSSSGNQLLGVNAAATADEYKTLSGTTHQINVAFATGSITLSTPQNIDTTSSPTFSSLTLSNPLAVADGGTGQTALSAFVPTIQKFTSGSGTYTTPANVTWIRVRMVGGGGGGSGAGTSSGTAAGTGGNSTFGTSLLSAGGGAGGTWGGGTASGGSSSLGSGPIGIALTGGGGQGFFNSTIAGGGGMGGASAFGGAGGGGTSANAGQSGVVNTGGGGGGGGGNVSSDLPGPGGASGGYVDAIITSPSSTYSYSVGSAGSAGGAGPSGVAGGAGGSGIIIVEEHYI
jgi:hypothetical protein